MFQVVYVLIFMLSFQPEPKAREDFRWENRLLIFYTFDDSMEKELLDLSDEFKERKLLYFGFKGVELAGTNFSDPIEKASFLDLKEKGRSNWILFGLDGGIKASSDQGVDIRTIFKRIDSMPMRQSELRKKGTDGD